MSVKHNVVERGNPSNAELPSNLHPSIESGGRKTIRQIAVCISQISTVSIADTIAVLEAMLIVIPEEISAGNIVELGGFGSFWLRTDSEEAATAEEDTPLPRFVPGKEFKRALASIEFEEA